MDCQLEKTGDNTWKCPACGWVCQGKHPPRRNCPAVKAPSIVSRVPRYAVAVARWVAAGRPTRSDSDVQRIFETLCLPCPYIHPKHGSCKACGCRISKGKSGLLNKLKMGTERCPLNKWDAIVEVADIEVSTNGPCGC